MINCDDASCDGENDWQYIRIIVVMLKMTMIIMTDDLLVLVIGGTGVGW